MRKAWKHDVITFFDPKVYNSIWSRFRKSQHRRNLLSTLILVNIWWKRMINRLFLIKLLLSQYPTFLLELMYYYGALISHNFYFKLTQFSWKSIPNKYGWLVDVCLVMLFWSWHVYEWWVILSLNCPTLNTTRFPSFIMWYWVSIK